MPRSDSSVRNRGYTTAELAGLLRVGEDKIRSWIQRGEIQAINTSSTPTGRPRYVVLPDALAEWLQRHEVGPPPKPAPRRRRRTELIDYYPD